MTDLPSDVVEAVRSVFAACNAAASAKLTMAPNIEEEWLDHTWISEVTNFTSPHVVNSGWVVRFDAHYLGGMRHFRHFEIADIGVLVHLRLDPERRKSKVVLLQSKRLYPTAGSVREETQSDSRLASRVYRIPRISPSPSRWNGYSDSPTRVAYGAITRNSDQVKRIDDYERTIRLPVYYHLYNPWALPLEGGFRSPTPLRGWRPLTRRSGNPRPEAARNARRGVCSTPERGRPGHPTRASDVRLACRGFHCDEVLACHHGHEYQSIREERMWQLFNRRSGPIAASIAITIESPAVAAAAAAGSRPE